MIFDSLDMQLWQEIFLICIFAFCLVFLILIIILLFTSVGLKKKSERLITSEPSSEVNDNLVNNDTSNVLTTKELEIRKELELNPISKVDLVKLEKAEDVLISDDFVINAITQKELGKNKYHNVLTGNTNFDVEDIKKYILSKDDVSFAIPKGMRPLIYKVNGKALALIKTHADNKYSITLKLGPTYASKMMNLLPSLIINSTFPHGIIWFTYSIDSLDKLTIEALKEAIDISYEFAALGY